MNLAVLAVGIAGLLVLGWGNGKWASGLGFQLGLGLGFFLYSIS